MLREPMTFGQNPREIIMLRSISLFSLLALAAPAMADGLNYNYLEFGYAEVDVDDSFVDVDGDGFFAGGSFEVGESTFVFADYRTADLDLGVDLDQIFVGIGLHTPIGENVDFVGSVSYVSVEASAFGLSADDDGYGASVGIRAMISDALELAGSVNYIDLSDSGDDTSIGAEAWYNFSDTFAVGLQADFGDDITQYGIGARLYFGQ